MDLEAPKKAQQVMPMPMGMRGSSLSRRVNFCQRFSLKKSLDGVSAVGVCCERIAYASNEEGRGASDILGCCGMLSEAGNDEVTDGGRVQSPLI